MLNGAGDTDSEIEFGRDRLAGAANLALHGQPAVIADGPRRSKLAAKRCGEFFHHGQVVLFLDTAAYGDDDRGGAEIDGLRCLAEGLLGLIANSARVDLRREGFDAGVAGLKRFRAEGA